MDKKIVEKNIKQILKDNNLHKELFLVDKNIFNDYYNFIKVGIPCVGDISPQRLNMKLNDISNILGDLHSTYETDLNKLTDNLKLSYLHYISKTECLLDYLEEVVRNNLENYFNLKIITTDTIPSLNLERILECRKCTNCESIETVMVTITVNGDIKFKFDTKEIYYKLVMKDPFEELFYRPIQNLFIHEMNKLNFQEIIDRIKNKFYLSNQKEKVFSETCRIKLTLDNYKKSGFNVLKIENEKIKKIV
ncbi:hypothetical protein HBE96_00285 [Clostridium sp. P21]|uniref:Uncharacterized protein n=1 Tax=Clostridium muellerianum TaxID=2716538 RepID=A0A7Y0ECX2_9CLOT|nr:hypothetical protein [Clostridium muellerianum]NMM61164.1 hypothetical protein [Clostridium muellerianum]